MLHTKLENFPIYLGGGSLRLSELDGRRTEIINEIDFENFTPDDGGLLWLASFTLSSLSWRSLAGSFYVECILYTTSITFLTFVEIVVEILIILVCILSIITIFPTPEF